MYEKLREYIEESNNIVFFGGAGVSTESGIPDFRSKDGLYNQHDVQFDKYEPEYLLSRECLYNNPKVFYEFYRQKMDTRNIEPNITHKVLAKMEEMGKLKAIVTQNIIRKLAVRMSLKFMELLRRIIVVSVKWNIILISYLTLKRQFQNANVVD